MDVPGRLHDTHDVFRGIAPVGKRGKSAVLLRLVSIARFD
jgi:hypothetical protein